MFVPTDLHGHTYFSDGRATPEDYVEFRRQHGFKAIAVADHDVLAAVRRASIAAAQSGIVYLPALEVTSFLHFGTKEAEQFHVLAYWPADVLEGSGLEKTAFWRRGLRVQEKWKAFVLAWMDSLPADANERLGRADLERLPPPMFPALQSMIDRVVERDRPLFESFRDHHWKFWNDDRELFGWTPEESIEAIRADGAVDIVAHPTRYRDKEATDRVLDFASGFEVYTSRHKPEVAEAFRQRAEAKKKFWTASSDDHQNAKYVKPPCGTPVRTLERILRKPVPVSMLVDG
ncbi:MAG: PHP domain-containing protein [Polyangiaceae bacterium]